MGNNKQEVLPATLNLLLLKTLATKGPLHGYGIARRIEHEVEEWNRTAAFSIRFLTAAEKNQ